VSPETARAELSAPVASEPAASALAMAPESTEVAPAVAPAAPKKSKKARTATRRDRPSRDYFNPFRFFASGPSTGSRPWF
jgi:hypothetical protein